MIFKVKRGKNRFVRLWMDVILLSVRFSKKQIGYKYVTVFSKNTQKYINDQKYCFNVIDIS